MQTTEASIQSLMAQHHPVLVRRGEDGYASYVPTLGILASGPSLDACYEKTEAAKRQLFEDAVRLGFGDAVPGRDQPRAKRTGLRMLFTLAVLGLVLLIVLIPADYILSQIAFRLPTYMESAMGVAERRLKNLSENDKRTLSGLFVEACPVVNTMVNTLVSAQCTQPVPASARSLPAKGR